MSITSTYTHKLETTFEQYSFASNVNPKQRPFVDIDEGGLWKLGLVQLEEALSLEELQEFRSELAGRYGFMVGLNNRDLRRSTEPGEPDTAGRGGGL